jgi:hypothetical protein
MLLCPRVPLWRVSWAGVSELTQITASRIAGVPVSNP